MDKITGIYKITNKMNGKCYIGQSVDIKRRWWNHKSCNGNADFPLYKAIKEYGLSNFIFEVLETCTKEKLNQKELYYINKYDSVKNGYNPTNITDNPFYHKEILEKALENMTKTNRSLEHREKQSKITKKLWQNEEYREKVTKAIQKAKESIPRKIKNIKEPKEKKIRLSRMKCVPMKIQANTNEWRENKSIEIKKAWEKGCYSKEQSRKNLNKFREKFNTDSEYKEKVIQHMRENRPNSIAIDMLDKETNEKIMDFPKIMDGAKWIRENTKYIKADYATINKVCKGKAKTAYGYKWRYSKKEGDLK